MRTSAFAVLIALLAAAGCQQERAERQLYIDTLLVRQTASGPVLEFPTFGSAAHYLSLIDTARSVPLDPILGSVSICLPESSPGNEAHHDATVFMQPDEAAELSGGSIVPQTVITGFRPMGDGALPLVTRRGWVYDLRQVADGSYIQL